MERKSFKALIFILLFGLILRLIFFVGFTSGDDLGYYNFASQVLNGPLDHSQNFHATRIGLIYPTAFFYSLFGISIFTSALLSLITGLLTIVLAFYIAKHFFNEKAGIVSAFLMAIYPVQVSYSTVLYPDLPAALLTALSAYVFFLSQKKNSIIGFLSTGILGGFAYLMKELSVAIFVFFGLYVLFYKKLNKKHLLILLGFLLVFAFEMLYYSHTEGNFMYRFSDVQGDASNIMKHFYSSYFGPGMWKRLLFHYPYVLWNDPLAKFFFILFLGSIFYFLYNGKKETYPLILWVIVGYSVINFGSTSLSEYVPLPVSTRYLEIITMPMIVLAGYFLTQKGILKSKILFSGIVLLLLTTSIYGLSIDDKRTITSNLRQTANYLGSANIKIYTDFRSAEILRHLFNYQKNDLVKQFNSYEIIDDKNGKNILLDMSNLHDSYVVVDSKIINALKAGFKDLKLPKEIENPPSSWVLNQSFGNDEKVNIYYVK